jgi:hypothetical protein
LNRKAKWLLKKVETFVGVVTQGPNNSAMIAASADDKAAWLQSEAVIGK